MGEPGEPVGPSWSPHSRPRENSEGTSGERPWRQGLGQGRGLKGWSSAALPGRLILIPSTVPGAGPEHHPNDKEEK